MMIKKREKNSRKKETTTKFGKRKERKLKTGDTRKENEEGKGWDVKINIMQEKRKNKRRNKETTITFQKRMEGKLQVGRSGRWLGS